MMCDGASQRVMVAMVDEGRIAKIAGVLFVAEGDDGIDAAGAASGDGGGENRSSEKNQRCAAENYRVVAFHSIELAC